MPNETEAIDEILRIGAAYIRVSDERQDEFSPTSQLKKIRERAAHDRVLIPDEHVFYDDGISGRSTRKREDFARMISLAKSKEKPFTVIYVWKFSRFARSQEDSIVLKSHLKRMGIDVVSVSEPIPDGPFGSLIERVIEWSDEYYSINLGVEVKRGLEEKFDRGEPTQPAPFGYINKDKTYVPDEESGSADVIREVFSRFINGDGVREIASSLTSRGICTRRGKPIDNRWVKYVLRNPTYAGMMRRRTGGKRLHGSTRIGLTDVAIVKGKWEPIISEDDWARVQQILDEMESKYAKHARRDKPIMFALKGLVRCSACGGTLVYGAHGARDGEKGSLQCHNYSRGSCTVSHSIKISTIEQTVIDGLKAAVDSLDFEILPSDKRSKANSYKDYNKMIEVENKRLDRAKQAFLAEIDTLEQYAANKKDIERRIKEINKLKDAEKEESVDVKAFAKKVSDVLVYVDSASVDDADKNELLHTIIDKIVFNRGNGSVAIYFKDPIISKSN